MRLPGAFPLSFFPSSLLLILSLPPLHAAGQPVVLSPPNVHFGKVAIGWRNVRTVTITNRSERTIRVKQAITRGAGFTLKGFDLPLVLESGESFTFSSVFSPLVSGEAKGSISFVSQPSTMAKSIPMLVLTGTGSDGNLDAEPPTINFGNVLLGTLDSKRGTLTAVGTAVTIASVDISDSEFTLSGLSFPLSIPAGEKRDYTVQFAPQVSGDAVATLSFLTDTGNSLSVQTLTATAREQQQQHSVELTWNASTSQNVIGYNVYRGATSGGPYGKINNGLDANTDYTDTTVMNGNTYYYVTTAVDSNNQESVYSNEAQAIIPGEHRANHQPVRGWGSNSGIAMRSSPSRTRR